MKHKYMAIVPKANVFADSGEKVETIAERNGGEFLGSRLTKDGDLQVGYSCEPSKAKDIELYLHCCGMDAALKDYGEDDGKRGRVTRADTSGYPVKGETPKKVKAKKPVTSAAHELTEKPATEAKVKAVKVLARPDRKESFANPVKVVVIEGAKPSKRKPVAKNDSPTSEDSVIPPIGKSFAKWSDLGSPEHKKALMLLGQGCEDPVMAHWGKFSVWRAVLARVLHNKLQKASVGWDEEKRNCLKRLDFNSTITQFIPFVKEAYGKDADFIIWHTCHSK